MKFQVSFREIRFSLGEYGLDKGFAQKKFKKIWKNSKIWGRFWKCCPTFENKRTAFASGRG